MKKDETSIGASLEKTIIGMDGGCSISHCRSKIMPSARQNCHYEVSVGEFRENMMEECEAR